MRISVHIEAKDENDLRHQLAAFFKPSYEQEEMFSDQEMGAIPANGNGIAKKKVETEYKKKPGRKPAAKPEDKPEEPTVKSVVPDLSMPEKEPEPAVKVPKLTEPVKLVTATQDECREALKKVISTKGRETAMDCLADFNVAKFSELNAEDYPKFIETCNAAVL